MKAKCVDRMRGETNPAKMNAIMVVIDGNAPITLTKCTAKHFKAATNILITKMPTTTKSINKLKLYMYKVTVEVL